MRNPFLSVILGYTGTGKTTYEKRIIEYYRNKVRDRVLVITPHDIEFDNLDDIGIEDMKKAYWWRYSGVKRHIATDKTIKLISHPENYFRNGLLIFDDVRFFVNSKVDKELHQLFISRKQRGIDMIASAHGFTEVPPKFFTFASEIVLFKTLDNIKKRKDVLRNFETILKIQQEVNKHPDIHYHKIIKMI